MGKKSNFASQPYPLLQMNQPRKICFITGTRADYGIMAPLMLALRDDSRCRLQVIATNMHLSAAFGMTVDEIERDGITVDEQVVMLDNPPRTDPVSIVRSMSRELSGMADALQRLRPDMVVILGDRYEMLTAASACLIFGIPVAHIAGGDITEGAIDDSIRHAITKLSRFHFTTTDDYRQRVIQLGEEPSRVFHVGSLAAETLHSRPVTMSLQQLNESIGFDLSPRFLLVTFHPVTTEPRSAASQTSQLLEALTRAMDMGLKVLFTMPNSDANGSLIADMIKDWTAKHSENAVAVASLGHRRYYAALAHCAAVVGNSSSGLCEAPSFGVATIDIGNRQRGRAAGPTVFHCEPSASQITDLIKHVTSPDTITKISRNPVNPYYKPGTLDAIHNILITTPLPDSIAKRFYDLRP